jgi:hypothetical protein
MTDNPTNDSDAAGYHLPPAMRGAMRQLAERLGEPTPEPLDPAIRVRDCNGRVWARVNDVWVCPMFPCRSWERLVAEASPLAHALDDTRFGYHDADGASVTRERVERHVEQIEATAVRVTPVSVGTWSSHSGVATAADSVVISPVDLAWLLARTRAELYGAALCSQCGERESAMVKVGTLDGWCTACLDEAAGVGGPRGQSVTQEWVTHLPMMQQTVLLTAVRGPDNLPKYHATKWLLRWYRRCILLSALDGAVLTDPCTPNGGSLTGPSCEGSLDGWRPGMDARVTEYLRSLDEVPHHFQLHLMHAVEILGYKHPDSEIRDWWRSVYERLVHDMHLWPETEEQLDARLGDTREGWLARGDEATND